MSDAPPPFDPSKPFTTVAPAAATPPPFDPSKPFTRAGTAPTTETPSGLEAFGTGAKQAFIDTGMGIAQGMSRLRNAIPFLPQTAPEARPEAMDKLVAQQAQQYQANPAVRAHPYYAGAGQFAGNIAATAPLALVPGGPLARLGLAGRLGQAGGIGAGAALTQPVQVGPGQSYLGQKGKQALEGGAGGVAGGAVGELVGSTLGNAIAGNNTAAIDRYLTGQYRSTVKPQRLSGAFVGAPQLGMQDNRILTAVDKTIELSRNGALQITNEAGDVLPRGAFPQSLRQFSEATDDGMKQIFQQYDQMAENTGRAGIKVGMLPAAQLLREVATNPTLQKLDKEVVNTASGLADNFERDLFYRPTEVQDIIKKLNTRITKDIRAQGSSELKPVIDNLRQSLETAIVSLPDQAEYQLLKNQYGAYRSIQKDIASAVQREANKKPWGSGIINFAAAEELLRGVWHGDVKAIGTAAAIKGAQAAIRYINEPNRAIARLFRQRANPPGALRTGLGQATLSLAPPVGALTGGQAPRLLNNNRDLRPSVSGF